MINPNSAFGEMLESGQHTVQKAAKSTTKGVQNFANTAAGQVQNQAQDQGVNETASAKQNQQKMSDDDAKKFLQGLYGVPDRNNNSTQKPASLSPKQTVKTALGVPESSAPESAPTTQETIKSALGIPEAKPAQRSPEETVKIEALRKKLHEDYYQALVNPAKQPEESAVEKIEREDQEEKLADLETNKEKPPPLPATVKQGTGENVVGVSG